MNHTENDHAEKHPKQEFQVERLAFFSDAVFAIAITLLIIEFKVPHISTNSTYTEVLDQLSEMKAEMVTLLMSYFLIAVYWVRHHSLYKYIHDYNNQLVVANMAALLPIIFLPFSTAFFAECTGSKSAFPLGFQVFALNHFAAGITIYAVYWLAIVKHRHMSYEIPKKEKIKFYEQTLLSSIIFVVLFATSVMSADKNVIMWVLVGSIVSRTAIIGVLKRTMK